MSKAFIAQVVKDKGSQQKGIMDKLHIMDQKFDALCREIFNIEISVNTPADCPGTPKENTDLSPAYEGTPSKPILVDEEQMEKNYKRGCCPKQEDGPSA